MRLTKFIAVLAASAGALTFAQTAVAQDEAGSGSTPDLQGDVVEATGDTGSVVVERQGNLYSLSEGDDLFEGDIVQTTSGGTTTLEFTAANGTPCSVTLEPLEIFTVSAASCSSSPVAMTSTQIAALEGTAVAGTAGSGVGAAVFGIPAGLAAIGGVAAATGGDDDGTPASPG
ncbi:hypothetical protein [Henriciella algicola]|uniref:Uncharacterized protein n=1 Tax=Henriciella algicola TaxID=1608422 RepID=A0A399RFB6_9PROT|nr:hypothetical protein [Henriciella algicola]RIJ29211.1 hypothetical protein D1222_12735 [Henriciella algicola]